MLNFGFRILDFGFNRERKFIGAIVLKASPKKLYYCHYGLRSSDSRLPSFQKSFPINSCQKQKKYNFALPLQIIV